MNRWRFLLVFGLLAGATYLLSSASHGEPVPVRQQLQLFPQSLGPWFGTDFSLDPRVEEALKADAWILRSYQAERGSAVWLFISYYQSQRLGESVHSPRSCLPGAGWEPVSSSRPAVELAPGHVAVLNRYVVQKGTDRQLVYYWYQAHGRTIASEYRAKAYLVADAIRLNRTDGALVRVSVPILDGEAAAQESAMAFIREMYPLLGEFIPD